MCIIVPTTIHLLNWRIYLQTKRENDITNLLSKTVEALNQINEKIDAVIKNNERLLEVNERLLQAIIEKNSTAKKAVSFQPDSMALLTLPSALRKTAMVLYELEQATADELAKETKRLRAVESAAANELFRLGYVKKKREGREVYFYIESRSGENE